MSKYWKIPPDGSAAFVVCMEDVLDVYQSAYDPQFPIVCMDESNKQLVGEVHAPLPPAPGRGQIVDHEYVRNGVAEIFLEVEPLTGQRHVAITAHRTRKDWALFIKGMLDERYPQATKVRLVLDNLNTHNDLMRTEVAVWERDRNNRSRIIDWRFTSEDARIKLKRLYPKL